MKLSLGRIQIGMIRSIRVDYTNFFFLSGYQNSFIHALFLTVTIHFQNFFNFEDSKYRTFPQILNFFPRRLFCFYVKNMITTYGTMLLGKKLVWGREDVL